MKVGHGTAKGDQQEAAAGQRRVHEVSAKASKEALYEKDRKDRTNARDVQRNRR